MQEKTHTQYMVFSFSHKNTDIAMREKISFKQNEIVPFLQILNECEVIRESVLLSTCNRTEIYVSMSDRKIAREYVFLALANAKKIPIETLKAVCALRLNQYAVYHIFSVASSLDSIVIGETQITGQLKLAYKIAFENALCGKDLTRLMHFAFKCAATVRTNTDISAQSVSVASTAVKMAEDKLKRSRKKDISSPKSLKNLKVLVIGSGEIGELVCKHLIHTHARITIISRNIANAKALAEKINESNPPHLLEVASFEHLEFLLTRFNLVFSATSAPSYIIHKAMARRVQKVSNIRRYWFDLALPRDIEPARIKNLSMFCVDDLQAIVSKHKHHREDSAKNASKIVENFSMDFFRWLQTLGIDPVIKQMRYLAQKSAQKQLERALKKGFIPREYAENIQKLLHSAFNTFLHNPTMRLKLASENPQGDSIIEAIKNIFDISDDIMLLNHYKCEKDTTF